MLRVMVEAIEAVIAQMNATQEILAAIRRNGFGALRPSLSQGKFVRADGQAWCQTFPEGNHRMKKEWVDQRYSFLDEDGMPKPPEALSFGNQEEQSYHGEEGCERGLKAWEAMQAEGGISDELIQEWKSEPWFEMVVDDFKDTEGFQEYKELMNTPKQLRKELGIDEKLTSQKKNLCKMKAKWRGHKKYREAMRPMRKEVVNEMRRLMGDGYSRRQIVQSLVPQAGKTQKSSLRIS